MTKSATLNGVFAVLAAIALVLAIVPAFVSADDNYIANTTVSNNNGAIVWTGASATAKTGGNYAGGADGGNGGDGLHNGDATSGGDDNNDATTGNGGNGGVGGAGGDGGTVYTGNATAGASTMNVVNSNDVRVIGCGCNNTATNEFDNETRNVRVSNDNRAGVFGRTDAEALTGGNIAGGADGGNGGEGDYWSDAVSGGDDNNDATTGHGGNGGAGGAGGSFSLVDTGNAVSGAATVNVVNTNLVRVRR